MAPHQSTAVGCRNCLSDVRGICKDCLSQKRSKEAWKYLFENLWDIYPLFHPQAFNAICTAAMHAEDDDATYFDGVFYAMTSLGALYLGDEEFSSSCYSSAEQSLNGWEENPRIEGLMTSIVLVYLLCLWKITWTGNQRLCRQTSSQR